MTAILITLIFASWVAVAIIGVQANCFGEQAQPSYQPIAIPVKSQFTDYAAWANYQR